MAAPMTELLFVFLLGIATWSGCVAENTVTMTGISCGPAGDNGVISSWDCSTSDNLFNSKINVGKGCPGVVQSSTNVLKDGNVVNNVQKSHKNVVEDMRDLNVCQSIDGPDPDDDNCSAPEGEISADGCDMGRYFKDMDDGDYEIRMDFSIDDELIGTVKVYVKVEG